MEILSMKDDALKFILDGVDISFANALRRTIISEVPCMAIDEIFIFDNSSVLPDEGLANRIGFIPIKTNLDEYILPEKCECGSELGCNKCRVVFTMDVESESEKKTVYSGDLISEDPDIQPVSPDILLTKLAPGQVVRLEAYACLGLGNVHAKWQPVSQATYQQIADIRIDNERCTNCGDCIKACPTNVFTLENEKLSVTSLNSCILCGACAKACPLDPTAVTQDVKENTFLFIIESTGCMSPERIVLESAKTIISKIDELSKKIENDETDEEITEFEVGIHDIHNLYSVGARDNDEKEEEK